MVERSRGDSAFITFLSVPLTFSIADGLALGFISYPVIKLLAGRARRKMVMYVLAAVLAAYLVFVRGMLGSG